MCYKQLYQIGNKKMIYSQRYNMIKLGRNNSILVSIDIRENK